MATDTISATNYRGHRASRASRTASFASNAFSGRLPVNSTTSSSFLPVGWDEATTTKCRSGFFTDIDFSVMQSITSATLSLTYFDVTPNDQVNQTCTASRSMLVCRATADYDTAAWNLSTSIHTATGAGTVAMTSTTGDGDTFSVDVTSIVQYWFANAGTNLGFYMRMSTDTSGTYAPALTTPSSNMPAASFYDNITLTIDYVVPPEAPSAPNLVIQDIATDGGTYGSTTAIKTFSASTTTQCNLRFSFIDANEPDGDYCQQYTIEVFNNSSFSGSPVWSEVKVTTGSPTGTITYVLDFNNVPKDVDLYWRVKTADTMPGTYGPYSSLTNGSGASQEIAKFRIQAANVEPPPSGGGGGNPTYASVSTFARNKFRVEFYQIQDTVTAGLEIDKADTNPSITPSFNPTPKKSADGNWLASAIIHDGKKIGISQQVNGAGEFFLTLPSNHPQIGGIVPLRTFWRACRWDEKAGYFIVIGEGLVTETASSPNEVIIYGIDKLGMLSRLFVSVDVTMRGGYYTFGDGTASNGFRLDQIHDSLLPAAGGVEQTITKSVTTRVSVADATKGTEVSLTTSAAHTFVVGDVVTVSDMAISFLNGTFLITRVGSTTQFSYNINNTSSEALFPSTSDAGTAVVNRYSRTMFEPFQATRNILNNTTDVSSNPSSGTLRTVTEKRSIMCDGKSYLDTLAEFADILMAGTTDIVVIEDPNIGLPADNPKNLNQGIQYRHHSEAQIPSPKFWLKYGDSVNNFRYEPFTSKIASRASIINYSYDTSATTSTSLFGVKSALNNPIYDNYGLIEVFERIDDERNDIQFAANLLYNKYPNQVVEFNLAVVATQITPFSGYKVGDLIQIYLNRRNVSVTDKFVLTRQEWAGNEDGSENISFIFSPQQRTSFKVSV